MPGAPGGSAPLPVFPSHGPTSRECPGPLLCPTCFLYREQGGPCGGCTPEYRQRCLKRSCNYRCATCAGGRNARSVGVCGSAAALWASWRGALEALLTSPVPDYAPPLLPLRCRLIPMLTTDARSWGLAEAFPGIDAWGVTIERVADRKGRFRSADLKDYLGLPTDRRLILSTCAPDDYREMLWDRRGSLDFAAHGVDYWFPGHFSIYDDDSKMYQFASAKRQQLHAVATRSPFVWFRLGENIPLEFLAPVRGAGNVLISSQQQYSPRNRAILAREVALADGWFPPESAFFVVGGMRTLSLPLRRKVFEVHSGWLFLALAGKDLARRRVTDRPRREIARRNLEELLDHVDPDRA